MTSTPCTTMRFIIALALAPCALADLKFGPPELIVRTLWPAYFIGLDSTSTPDARTVVGDLAGALRTARASAGGAGGAAAMGTWQAHAEPSAGKLSQTVPS